MTPEPSRFDDPALKAAVRCAWGGETAPPGLRRRIHALLAADQAEHVIHPSRSLWRQKFLALGMAAAAAIAVGVAIFVLQRQPTRIAVTQPSKPAEPVTVAAPVSVPSNLGRQLIATHDACARRHADDHHLFQAAPRDNFKTIAERMTAVLRHPVLAAPMGHDWDFRGAAICPVGSSNAAHLLFTREGAFVSVFSLPASMFPDCPNLNDCEAALNGRPLAGFVEGRAFHCVVASSPPGGRPLDLTQVKAMRDQLRVQVSAQSEHLTPLAAR